MSFDCYKADKEWIIVRFDFQTNANIILPPNILGGKVIPDAGRARVLRSTAGVKSSRKCGGAPGPSTWLPTQPQIKDRRWLRSLCAAFTGGM